MLSSNMSPENMMKSTASCIAVFMISSSAAKVEDFERECDCEDIVNLALWDSETDEERTPQKILDIARHIDNIEGLSAWVDGDRIAVSPTVTMNKEAVADYIESVAGFPSDEVRWVVSDESVNTAWYEVKSGEGREASWHLRLR